jgi:hypothetical protein
MAYQFLSTILGSNANFTGNVGVGTTTPGYKLDVVGGAIRVSSQAFNVGGYRLDSYPSANSRNWLIGNDYAAFGDFAIAQSTTPTGSTYTVPLYINLSGNVGIGTTSPSSKLTVAGNIEQTSTANFVYTNNIAVVSSSANLVLNSSSANVIIPNGNVGIGTASPTTKLCITDNATMYAYQEGAFLDIKRNASNGNDLTSRVGLRLGNNSNAFSIFYGGTSDRLRFIDGGGVEVVSILNGGNVGIGTTTAQTALQVGSGTVSSIPSFMKVLSTDSTQAGVGAVYNNKTIYLYASSSVLKLDAYDYGASSALSFSLATNGGNVLIGTTTDAGYKLDVNASLQIAKFNGTSGSGGYITLQKQSSDIFYFGPSTAISGVGTNVDLWGVSGYGVSLYSNGSTLNNLTLTSSGNVGIGTTTPNRKLTISNNGDALIGLNTITNGISTIGANFSGSFIVYDDTASTYRLVVKQTSGNVGIGTENPSWKLVVSDNGGAGLEINPNTSSNAVGIYSYDRINSAYRTLNLEASKYVFGVGNVLIGTSTDAGYKLDVNGTGRFSSNLAVDGITATGNRKLSLGILDLNSGGTPAQMRINTTIPFASGGADFTVNIKGFRYGAGQMVSLSIGWHYYLSSFYNENAICNGAWKPTITLACDANGYVVIHLSTPDYWPKLYVESVYSSAYANAYSSGWNWTDANLSDCTNLEVVPYRALATDITGSSSSTSAVSGTTNYISKFTSSTTIGDSLVYDNGTNVGIGTTSPSYKLVVNKTSVAAPAIMIGGAYYGGPRFQTYGLDADADAWMGLGADMGIGSYEHSIYYPAYAGAGKLTFGTYNGTTYSTKMMLAGTGNLLIGTTTDAGYKLDVNGDIRTQTGYIRGANSDADIRLDGTVGSQLRYGGQKVLLNSADAYIYTANTPRVIVNNAGSVGIGTTSPASLFSVAGNATLGQGQNRPVTYDSFGGNFRITASPSGWATGYFFNGSSGTFRGGFGAYGDFDNVVYHWIGDDYNVPTMALYPNQGSVCIGTTTPLLTFGGRGNLTINGASESILTLGIANSWKTYLFASSVATELGSNGFTNFYVNGAGTLAMRLATSGNVLIGTTTDVGDKLYVVGTSRVQTGTYGLGTTPFILNQLTGDTRSVSLFLGNEAVYNPAYETNTVNGSIAGIKFGWYSDNWMISATRSGGGAIYGFVISQNGSEKLVIGNTGNVGIGTTTPGAKLTVVGASSNTYLAIDNAASGENYYAANNFHAFQTAGAERMRITSSGQVGINNSVVYHGANLSVANKIFLSFQSNSDIGGTIYGYYDTSLGGYYGGLKFQSFKFNGSSYVMADAMTINGLGNVGIGTTTPLISTNYGTLTIDGSVGSFTEYRENGTAYFRVGADAGRPFIYSITGAPIDFYIGGTVAQRIASSANVLIGTTTDNGGKLQVNGDAYFGTFLNTNFRYSFIGSGTYNSYHTYIVNTNSSNGTYGLGINNYNTSSDGYILGLSSAGIERFYVKNDGNVNASSLAGSGTRMVVADASGTLSTQAIPGGGSANGSWQENSTQTAPANNTGVGVKFSTLNFRTGVNVIPDSGGQPTLIQMVAAGRYDIQFSFQFENADNIAELVYVWLRKNGENTPDDIPDSNTIISVPAKHGSTPGKCVAAWNFFVEAAPGDFFQLAWATADATNVSMPYYAATGFCPATPSAILTVNQVD